MTTDKELADAICVVLDNCHGSLSRDMLLKAKDELDPKPTYPDGTYAHVTHGNPAHTTIARFNASANRWVVGWSWDGFDEAVLEEGCADLVEPLRVLGDDEIAIRRTDDITHEMITGIIDGLSHCRERRHFIARDVLDLIRDALDAEQVQP